MVLFAELNEREKRTLKTQTLRHGYNHSNTANKQKTTTKSSSQNHTFAKVHEIRQYIAYEQRRILH